MIPIYFFFFPTAHPHFFLSVLVKHLKVRKVQPGRKMHPAPNALCIVSHFFSVLTISKRLPQSCGEELMKGCVLAVNHVVEEESIR